MSYKKGVLTIVVVFCGIAATSAALQSILDCMNQGYVTPVGNEYSPFFIHRGTKLLSCRPTPSTNCSWTEDSYVYASLFIYKDHRLITTSHPIRQIDIEKWELTDDLTKPGRVLRVYENLYPTGAKAAYLRLMDRC